jgi:hypothetical protein
MPQNTRRNDFWNGLSTRARVKLSIAIFFTFATIGIFQDFWAPGAPPWPWIVVQCINAGAIALSWAYTFMWSKKFIPAIGKPARSSRPRYARR